MARKENKDRGLFERVKGSGYWSILYYDTDGRRHREDIGPKSLAKRVYQKRKTEIREGRFFLAPRRKVTIGQVLEAYQQYEQETGHKIMDTPQGYVRVKACFGGRAAEGITRVEVEEFAQKLKSGAFLQVDGKPPKPMAASTVNHHISLISAAMRRAFRAGMIPTNPLSDLSRLKENNKRDRYLTDDEEDRLLGAMPKRVRPLVITAIHTGLRKGELKELRRRAVDLFGEVLRVEKSKSGEARDIPLNPKVLAALRALMKGEDGPDAYVFRSSSGDALTNLREIWDDAVAKAKLVDFTFHDMRHTFASRLVMSGVELRTVQILMGHSSIKLTERYAHLAPEHLRSAVNKLAPPEGAPKPWHRRNPVAVSVAVARKERVQRRKAA